MGKKLLLFVILIWSQALLWCNPIDNTPITKFSELFFDNNNNWAMQIYFPFGYQTISSGMGGFDSVIFIVSNTSSKLNISYPNGTRVGVITSDSLTTPLVINREGDKVVICTYSHYNSSTLIRQDAIMFGNYPGATVGRLIRDILYSDIANCFYQIIIVLLTSLLKKLSLEFYMIHQAQPEPWKGTSMIKRTD